VTGRPHLEVGYVCRAHGLAGEVAVRTFDPGSEALFDVERVLLRFKDGGAQELTIDSIRSANKELLLGFEGVEGRTQAEKMVGGTVLVFREDIAPPAEGEYFQGDLLGLTALDEQGNVLGTVEDVWSSGPVPNLVIRAEGKQELMVPFADDFVLSVDLPARRLTVRPPEIAE
jgi:16S rRNA processing protein RimM